MVALPTRSLFTTKTFRPAGATQVAAISPLCPPPMMTAA